MMNYKKLLLMGITLFSLQNILCMDEAPAEAAAELAERTPEEVAATKIQALFRGHQVRQRRRRREAAITTMEAEIERKKTLRRDNPRKERKKREMRLKETEAYATLPKDYDEIEHAPRPLPQTSRRREAFGYGKTVAAGFSGGLVASKLPVPEQARFLTTVGGAALSAATSHFGVAPHQSELDQESSRRRDSIDVCLKKRKSSKLPPILLEILATSENFDEVKQKTDEAILDNKITLTPGNIVSLRRHLEEYHTASFGLKTSYTKQRDASRTGRMTFNGSVSIKMRVRADLYDDSGDEGDETVSSKTVRSVARRSAQFDEEAIQHMISAFNDNEKTQEMWRQPAPQQAHVAPGGSQAIGIIGQIALLARQMGFI